MKKYCKTNSIRRKANTNKGKINSLPIVIIE